jgi:hypothetical protein
VLGGRWRPRRLGRISQQAQDYIANATNEQFAAVNQVLDAIEAGGEEHWETIPWAMLPSDYDNRVVVLLTQGDILVWAGYADYPSFYALIYIGPGHEFH